MSALTIADFIGQWRERLQEAAGNHPAVAFDGRTALPAWLAESARDQAERVFLVLDATPLEERDLDEADRLIKESGLEVLRAWQAAIDTFGVGQKLWAAEAADAAVRAYVARLNDLAPALHAGGRG